MDALMCKKHEVEPEEKSALLAYFFKLSVPTLRGRARKTQKLSGDLQTGKIHSL
jgi:hypothetical protein